MNDLADESSMVRGGVTVLRFLLPLRLSEAGSGRVDAAAGVTRETRGVGGEGEAEESRTRLNTWAFFSADVDVPSISSGIAA